MSGKINVTSVGEMHAVAGWLARDVKAGDVLLLKGPLGSGKTTFVQGLAGALGVGEQVTSPSFTLVTEYDVAGRASPPGRRASIRKLVHLDLYRLSDDEAAAEPAVREALAQSGEGERVTVVEWADKLGEAVPVEARRIGFAHGATEEERVVTVS